MMKVAIIEDIGSNRRFLKRLAKRYNWDVDFFTSSTEFGRADLDSYDVIVADEELPTTPGRDLIRSISLKTSAQLFLLVGNNSSNHEDIFNEKIKGLINKNDIRNLVSHLKYIETKLRINRIMEKETNKYTSIVPSNGFVISEQEGVAIIQITSMLTSDSQRRLFEELEKEGHNKAVISFPNESTLYSTHLGFLVKIYKFFTKRNGSVVFWNASKNQDVVDQIRLCNLNMLYHIYDSLDVAVESLTGEFQHS